MGMKSLLPLTAPKYLRRLARELNALPDGFYYDSTRCNRARFSAGLLLVRPLGNRGFRALPQDTSFRDAHGRAICASRS